jgi:flavin-dependent dehydrogenase
VKYNERFADVLVIGGGPSGLLLAGKLGRHLNLAILERNRLGETSKFWLTTESRLARHDLLSAAQYRTARATVGTFQGSFAYAEGAFTVVNERTLLDLLIEGCRRASVRLFENTKVLNIAKQEGHLVVHTTDGQYRARLVLDASGGASPFAATFRLQRLEGFYSIYGGHLEDLDLSSTDIVGAHIIHFGHPAPMFEVIPTGPTSAFCVVFLIARDVVDPTTLRDSFREHVSHNPFFKARSPAELGRLKMGVIPIGRASKKVVSGILPVGEAAMLQSPLLGAALNEILDHADQITSDIVSEFEKHDEGIVFPRIRPSMVKTANDRIQLMLVRPLLDGTLASFERLVEFLRRLGPQPAYRLLCSGLELSDAQIVIRATAKFLLSG